MATPHHLGQDKFDEWIRQTEVKLKVATALRPGKDPTLDHARVWGEREREACDGDARMASLSACEDGAAVRLIVERTYQATKNILPNAMFWHLIEIGLLGLILWRVW